MIDMLDIWRRRLGTYHNRGLQLQERSCQRVSFALFVIRLLSVSRSCHRFECFDTIVNRVDCIAVHMRIDCLQALSVVDSKGNQRRDNLAVSS